MGGCSLLRRTPFKNRCARGHFACKRISAAISCKSSTVCSDWWSEPTRTRQCINLAKLTVGIQRPDAQVLISNRSHGPAADGVTYLMIFKPKEALVVSMHLQHICCIWLFLDQEGPLLQLTLLIGISSKSWPDCRPRSSGSERQNPRRTTGHKFGCRKGAAKSCWQITSGWPLEAAQMPWRAPS